MKDIHLNTGMNDPLVYTSLFAFDSDRTMYQLYKVYQIVLMRDEATVRWFDRAAKIYGKQLFYFFYASSCERNGTCI